MIVIEGFLEIERSNGIIRFRDSLGRVRLVVRANPEQIFEADVTTVFSHEAIKTYKRKEHREHEEGPR